ncbi:MAG TPA: aldehyde dehydrogenase [Clostridia bacterium]|nr:aldehyde dehydrogenase [Clostridia bacterium]
MTIEDKVKIARECFSSGKTKSIDFRLEQLSQLEEGIRKLKPKILRALKEDLNKSPYEASISEIGIVLGEIHYVKKHLKAWSRPKRVRTALSQAPARSYIYKEPYGLVLIMAPWNYPFQLIINPLIGAISAGNAAVLKPSNYTPRTSEVIEELVQTYLDRQAFQLVKGGREENQALLDQRFDYIFFTGSPGVGRIVMEAASKHLTPVCLELGGKSPCLVEKTADIKKSAKRILFGKLMNSGQTCISPDYILVDKKVKKALIKELIEQYEKMLPTKEYVDQAFVRIINEKHRLRLEEAVRNQKIIYQDHRISGRHFPFTLVENPDPDSKLMQEEIFGPILPILSYDEIREAFVFIRKREKPLALYLFTKDKKIQRQVLEEVSFGGGCINDTLIHAASPYMPFGGVGQSGMGAYHGKKSFDTFSHKKSIVKKSWYLDLPLRYHPYKKKEEESPEFFFKL